MSTKQTAEELLISAMVNSGDDPSQFGVKPEMIISYPAEYGFAASYERSYNKALSLTAFRVKFPDFKLCEDSDVAFAAEEVIDAHIRRTVIKTVQTAAKHVENDEVDEAIVAMSTYSPPARQKPISNDLDDGSFLDGYEEDEDVIDPPWRTLHRVTNGIRKGELYYVAARLGQGKSWILANFAAEALMNGANVRYYSLEMAKSQVMTRMHVLLGRRCGHHVDHSQMRARTFDPQAYRKLVRTLSKEVPGNLSVIDSSDGKISPVSLVQDKEWSDLTLVDYAGLMSTPSGSRAIDDWRNMGSISNALKEVAISHNLRIIAAAQINRDGDTPDTAQPPRVKNLAQSDALGQDADVVLTHRQMCRTVMVYGVEKNRHGISGDKFYTTFRPNSGEFKEISSDSAFDIKYAEED